MLKHFAIFQTSAGNIARHRLRSLAVVLCLVSILSPFLSAVALLEGIKEQSLLSVEEGADIYVTMDLFGRNGVIPLAAAEAFKKIDGVTDAVPRVVGRIVINGRQAVLLGIPFDNGGTAAQLISGSFPKAGEVIMGAKLARTLKTGLGEQVGIGARAIGMINRKPYIMKKMFRIAGTFTDTADIRTADLVQMEIHEALSLYEMDGFASDIALSVKPGFLKPVVERLMGMNGAFRIQTKDLVKIYVERGLNTRGGVFTALYLAAFAVAVPVILVLTGMGLPERRKEVGVLKATGWRTREVMELVAYENLLFASAGASTALVVSFLWVRLLNGFFIARLFIPGIGDIPPFPVPSRFMPQPFLLSILLALALTLSGSLITTWRSAVAAPGESLR